MDRASFLNMYSRFDSPDIAERIAEKINGYIALDGIEELPGLEIHGRHTGYLSISSGGFRKDYDFLCPVLRLCRVDRNGIVSADIAKIEKHLASWRTSINSISDEELENYADSDFDEDDDKIWNMTSVSEYDYPNYYTDEEIAIYEQTMDELKEKEDRLLNRCREIFYGKGKEALHKYLEDLEDYSKCQGHNGSFDDPNYFTDTDIQKIRERFDVWDEEKRRLEMEEILERAQKEVDEYWNDPYREERSDWISPDFAEYLRADYEKTKDKPSFAEFVSLLRRGELGPLPEDYDGLAYPMINPSISLD